MHNARAVEMKLQKKELKEEYWPRLLKSTQKQHFLKTDFDKVCTNHRLSVVLAHTNELHSGSTRTSKTACLTMTT